MVNYSRVVCEAGLVAVVVALAVAAPVPDCSGHERHVDQRQNGTENYRLNIDGVVIAVAPAESLLSAAADIDLSDLLDFEDFTEKPKPPSEPQKPLDSKPQDSKPQDGKPESSSALAPLSDVSLDSVKDVKGQRKDAGGNRKSEKAQRLKNRLAHILLPLLRRNRHH